MYYCKTYIEYANFARGITVAYSTDMLTLSTQTSACISGLCYFGMYVKTQATITLL